jgi:hypothetical protein
MNLAAAKWRVHSYSVHLPIIFEVVETPGWRKSEAPCRVIKGLAFDPGAIGQFHAIEGSAPMHSCNAIRALT